MIHIDLILAPAWALIASSGLVLGGLAGWLWTPPRRLVAHVMAFGSGILIAAIGFDLLADSARAESLAATAVSFLAGAAIFTGGSMLLARMGARRARDAEGNSGRSIALATMLDGIPESLAIGFSLVQGGAIALTAVVAIFLSNIAEALAATVSLRRGGRSMAYVFGLWMSVALLGALAALAGVALLADISPALIMASQAFAAGAILAMLADTMIPEAFAETHDAAGLVTAAGFVAGYVLAAGGLG